MAIKLKKKDHRALDAYLDAILNAYKEDKITLLQARADLAHAMTGFAIDNEDMLNYIRLPTLEKWANA